MCSSDLLGATGTPAANALAARADVVLGVGTRWTDFTTGSRTVFADGVRFVNLNVARVDAAKHAATMFVADARAGLSALTLAVAGHGAPDDWAAFHADSRARWYATADAAYALDHGPLPAQTAILGAVNEVVGDAGTVVAAAGSLPGQLQMLYRAKSPRGYHVEYGYSCMGYEIAGALGVKMAAPERPVVALVGDGSYLMMSQEIVTAVSEGIALTIVLVDNAGFGSIGALSESIGSRRFGTSYRARNPATGLLDGGPLPVDLAANAASLGATVFRTETVAEFRAALAKALGLDAVTVVYVRTDPTAPAPSSGCWWDVPVAEVSELPETRAARARYEQAKPAQRPYL